MADGSWETLWWLPEGADAAVAGKQVAIAAPHPHLIFFPAGPAPPAGWPLVVFLHGQGESAPKPLNMSRVSGAALAFLHRLGGN